jgi:hypothetical protein
VCGDPRSIILLLPVIKGTCPLFIVDGNVTTRGTNDPHQPSSLQLSLSIVGCFWSRWNLSTPTTYLHAAESRFALFRTACPLLSFCIFIYAFLVLVFFIVFCFFFHPPPPPPLILSASFGIRPFFLFFIFFPVVIYIY